MLSLSYDDLPLWSAPFGLALLDTIRIRKNINVLDIGSGSGFPMLELAERLGRDCMVYGLEPSDEAIAMITAKKEARGLVFARVIRGVAEEIPFPDGYFGLIVSNNGLNNVRDPVRVLGECHRVAEAGAQMVLTMNLPETMAEFYAVFESTLRELEMQEAIGRMHHHISEKRKPAGYVADQIRQAGFTIRETRTERFAMRFASGQAFLSHHLIRTAFRPPWEAILPETLREPVFRIVEDRLNQFALEQGELVMTVPFVCFDCIK